MAVRAFFKPKPVSEVRRRAGSFADHFGALLISSHLLSTGDEIEPQRRRDAEKKKRRDAAQRQQCSPIIIFSASPRLCGSNSSARSVIHAETYLSRRLRWILSSILYLLFSIFLLPPAGCASAVAVGTNTALDGADLVKMTDAMSAAILASPAVQGAIADKGTLKVVVEPVVNQMQAEILTTGAGDAFTARLRALLSHHAPEKFTWIENRDSFYRLRNQELAGVDIGPSPDAENPQYALTATFTSMGNETDQSRRNYYVCNYSLTSLQDRSVLWTRSYEVQKQAVKGFLD